MGNFSSKSNKVPKNSKSKKGSDDSKSKKGSDNSKSKKGSDNSKSKKGSDNLKIIVLVGPTGCGKSQFIQCLVPEPQKTSVPVSSRLKHIPGPVQSFEIVNRNKHADNIILVDTPGFDIGLDIPISGEEVLKRVVKWKQAKYPKTKVAGILLLHSIRDNRLTHRPPENLLKDLRIDNAANQVALVTTHWDRTDFGKGKETEQRLEKGVWAPLSRMGAKMERFDKTSDTAWKIIERLLYSV